MADAPPVAEEPMESVLRREDTELEQCEDAGQFYRVHKFRGSGTGGTNILRIYKAMVGSQKYKELDTGKKKGGGKGDCPKALEAMMRRDPELRRRILKHRSDAVKKWNAKCRAEEESEEASSDDEAPLAVGDRVLMGGRSGVITALPEEGKHSAWYKLRLDGEEAIKSGRRGREFWPMGEQPPPPPRRSRREGAGELQEEQKRCNECDACLSMSQPPPGCKCSVCQGKARGKSPVCAELRKARENPPRCEKLAQDNLPAVGADEQGSAHLGDPLTLEERKLRDVAELIRENSDADLMKLAPDSNSKLVRGTTALFSVAAPGMPSQIAYVLKTLGDDTTKADLAEHVAAHLKECDFLDDDEDTRDKMICVVRAAAVAPDVETDPPATRSIMHGRAWTRIAKALCRQQRDEILALPKGSDALKTWLRTRAKFAVDSRSERQATAGSLANWRPGVDASLIARRTGLMFKEKAKGERYNNTEPFRLARNEFGRTDVTDNVKRLRETGPPPPSARKEKK